MIRLIRICRKCGAKIFSDAPESLCPRCVLKSALGNFAGGAVAGGGDPGHVGEPPRDETDAAAAGHNKKTALAAELLGELGDYELLEEVGRGGQGVVFRARQKTLNRTVALKVISLGQWASKAHVKRFRREAEAAASLEHPGIVPIHEVGERDGSCYFSMQFIEGGQLDEVVRREPMPIRRAVELIAKVARTVHYAHEHGILHRDIKPGNILLDQKGEPHLTDFGLARLVETESSVTQTLDVIGTPSYMAPEQAVGNNAAVSSVTDVYGLGAVLYQLLTGQPPFAGGTTYETIKLLLDTEPRPPRVLNPKVDRDLSTICLKCLEKDPKRRYPSALALAEDLEHWLKHEPIQARRSGPFVRGKKWVERNPAAALSTVLLIALAAAICVIVWKSEVTRHPLATGIAVLPFENLSEDKENAFLAEGIQDEILTRLSKVADLKVISRTSTQHLKSAPENLSDIAKQLGVLNVLEGSVQKAGDQVRVNVQLINALTQTHVWAEIYDRKLTDILAVESNIAKTVADTLQVKLTSSEKSSIAKTPTSNPEAYQLYLKGRFFWNKRSAPDLRRSIEYFNQAIEKDPNYALAHAAIAQAWVLLPAYGGGAPVDCFPQAEAAAEKALQLGDSSGDAYAALGIVKWLYQFDLSGALENYQKAIQLNPNNATAHHWLGTHPFTASGQRERAVAEIKRALELDPLSLVTNAVLGYAYLFQGRVEESAAQMRKVLEMDGSFYFARYNLGIALELQGMFPDALAEYQKAISLSDDPLPLALLGHLYGQLGRKDEALAIAQRLADLEKQKWVPAYCFAILHLGLGDRKQALDRLEQSYSERDGYNIELIRVDPFLAPLHGEPRFEALAEKIIPAREFGTSSK